MTHNRQEGSYVLPAGVDQWLTTIMQHLSQLSKPQATVLALWSFGMVLARWCALTAVRQRLAAGMRRKAYPVRQQLREWSYAVPRKRGRKRPALRVETCVAPLLAWVVRGWQGIQWALASDATPLGQRFVVRAVSVVYRGCASPMAWVMLPAGAKHAGRRAWLRLWRRRRRGWHPFLRINTGGSVRPAGATCWCPFLSLVPRPGTRWRGTGIAFTRHQVPGTLLARWEEGDKDPWLILTDLAPEASDAGWYGLRAWVEQGCKMTKRAGWPWRHTRMWDPDRAARLWLAVAVATLWLLSVGEVADETIPVSTLLDVTGTCPERPRTRRATRLRLVSVFRQGWVTILVALLRHETLPQGGFVPEPWPVVPPLEEEVPTPVRDMPKAA